MATSLIATSAWAQGDVDQVADREAMTESARSDVIIVTGTNIRGVENPAVPIITYDREELQLTGIGSFKDFIRVVPQNVPSLSPQSALFLSIDGSGANSGATTGFNLRGLGPGSTLTLLNGRRVVGTGSAAYTDISTLPLGIVERLDIATDGASAVYGTDAIGGVVNFITRSDFEGLEFNGQASTVTEGAKQDYEVGLIGGKSWGTGNGVLAVSHSSAEPLLYSERPEVIADDSIIIRLRPDSPIVGNEEVTSIYANINQSLGERLSFHSTAMHALRDYHYTSAPGRSFRSKVVTTLSSSELRYQMTNRLVASLFVDVADSDDTKFESAVTKFDHGLATAEFQLSGDAFTLPAGAVAFSAGAFARQETYDKVASVNENEERESYGAYGEVLIPLASEKTNFALAHELQLSLAGRYEDYDSLGDTFNPKVGVFWRPIEDLALRATYSESFRAPTLEETGGEPGAVLNVYEDPLLDPADDARNQELGLDPGYAIILFYVGANPDLRPEEAESFSYGFEYDPSWLDGFHLGANAFRVEYSDRVDSLGNSFEILSRDVFASLVDRDPDVATVQETLDHRDDYPNFNLLPIDASLVNAEDVNIVVHGGVQNINKLTVGGVDLFAQYEWDAFGGDMSAGLNVAYLNQYDFQTTPLEPATSLVDVVYRPTDLRARATLIWSRNGVTTYGAVNYADDYVDDINGPEPVAIDSYTTVDLSIGYDFSALTDPGIMNGARLQLSVKNVFEQFPPTVEQRLGLNYDPANADAFGRIVRLHVTKAF